MSLTRNPDGSTVHTVYRVHQPGGDVTPIAGREYLDRAEAAGLTVEQCVITHSPWHPKPEGSHR